MNKLIPILAVAVLVGCDEEGDPNRLVKRTDFDVPAAWALPQIMGRDFRVCLESPSAAHCDRSKAELPFYRDAAQNHVTYNGRNANDYQEGPGGLLVRTPEAKRPKKPYTFSDVFGASKLKLIDLPGNADHPVFLRFSADRPAFLANRDGYPFADCASYQAWIKDHPNCLGFRTLGEFDTQMCRYQFNWPQVASNAAVLAELRKDFPMPPAGTPHWTLCRDWQPKWIAKCFERVPGCAFGETRRWTLHSSSCSLGHIMADLGATGFFYEATSQGAGSWTVPGAFSRGASRQFGIPFGWFTANFYTGYTKDGKHTSGENWTHLKPYNDFPTFRRNGGSGQSAIRRLSTYGWLIGASFVEPENYYANYREEIAPGKHVPSAYAKDMEELWEFSQKTDRGVSYTPVALLTPLYERHERSMFDLGCEDPWSLNAFCLTLEPVDSDNSNPKLPLFDAQRRRGEEACFFNSHFGGIYDVICPDAPHAFGRIDGVLSAYKAAFVIGAFRKAELPARVFENYVDAGGTLFISGDKIREGLLDPAYAGVSFGKKTVPSGKRMISYESGSRGARTLPDDAGRARAPRGPQDAVPLFHPYDVMLPDGTPTATPLCRDENDNVIVWAHDVGKGRVVTVACPRMLPRDLAGGTHDDYYTKLKTIAVPGYRFEIIHELMERVQRETMPVQVEGDVMWGVNKVKVKGEGEEWLVWLFNNKGVTKYVDSPEEFDPSKAAKVTVRCGGESKTVTVAPGGIEYVSFGD